MGVARLTLVALIALAPMAWCALADDSAALDELSLAAWAVLVAMAVLGMPVTAAVAGARPSLAGVAFALPLVALGVVADVRLDSLRGAALVRAALGLLWIAVLAAAALRAAERGPSRRHLAAWLACFALAPALELALTLGSGAPRAPAWVEAWSSFSPLRWAASGLSIERAASALEQLRGAWRPALGAAALWLSSSPGGAAREARP